jgi:hypothetical protein
MTAFVEGPQFDPAVHPSRKHVLVEGEQLTGLVLRLPEFAAYHGQKLFLQAPDGAVLRLEATASCGHTVLERLLRDEAVAVGDLVTIRYFGKRPTASGERTYRAYEVIVHGR